MIAPAIMQAIEYVNFFLCTLSFYVHYLSMYIISLCIVSYIWVHMKSIVHPLHLEENRGKGKSLKNNEINC